MVLGDKTIGCIGSTQKCVTTATYEAEYVTLCYTSEETFFVTAVQSFLQPQLAGMFIDINGDNEGTMTIANNRSSVSRSKHIDVRAGKTRILHVGTEGQHADVLT